MAHAAKGTTGGEVVPGIPEVLGDASVPALAKLLKRHARSLRACYDKMLKSAPDWSGVGILLVRLDDEGDVLASKLVGPVAEDLGISLRICAQETVAAWRFPGVDRMGVRFKVPLSFGGPELKKGALRKFASARRPGDPIPPRGSLGAPGPDDGSSGETGSGDGGAGDSADDGSDSGSSDEWSFAPEEMSGASASSRKTDVSVGSVRAGYGIDLDKVNEVISKGLKELRSCWQLAVDGDSSLRSGKHILSIHVIPDRTTRKGVVYSVGSVTRVIGEAAVLCMEGAVDGWTFPSPKVAKTVVTAAFEMKAE